MPDDVIEKFSDVLQKIESAIVGVYEDDPRLLDLDVIDALDSLIRRYAAEEQKRVPSKTRLSEPAGRVYAAAEQACGAVLSGDARRTIGDVIACLKRIRKSVRLWYEEGGRQGYLNYVTEFFRQMPR